MTTFSDSSEHIDVAYVAQLARIRLTADETEEMQQQLDRILDYVKTLQELDVREVEPMAHAVPLENVLRKDETRACLDRDRALANAPAQVEHQILVPKIVE